MIPMLSPVFYCRRLDGITRPSPLFLNGDRYVYIYISHAMKPSGPSQRFPTSLTGGADGVANNGNSFDGVGRGGYTSSIDPESMEESKMSELSNIHLSAQRTESRLNM